MKREAGELLVCPHCRETQEAVILLDEERVQCIGCGQPFWVFVTMDDAPSFIVMASDPSLDQIALGVQISTSASESELEEARGWAAARDQVLDLLELQSGCFAALANRMEGAAHARTIAAIGGLVSDLKAQVKTLTPKTAQ